MQITYSHLAIIETGDPFVLGGDAIEKRFLFAKPT
jgi:hypothetical protein